ncbi:DUF6635 family protein [Pseudooceanicola onchidii]|uniref:DUF6635 family protein n=1 Tax=Pseudooceanicola onchidii TaxID=2562279 RepID=UPI001F0D1DBA|nr:DUF6635 family protein [Pseudooceanicola onchidii]
MRDPRVDLVRAFVRRVFGARGTLRLHRAALGWDLVKAPVNVVLAPAFLLSRLMALLAGWGRMPGLASWLRRRQVFFRTAVAVKVADAVTDLVADLRGQGLVTASVEAERTAIDAYVTTRSAVSEMVTTLFVLGTGALLFGTATPGMISLAGPMAERRAEAQAVAEFPLGQALGGLYYGVFPVALPVWQVVATGVALAVIGAIVTTFAGVLADPVQVATGTHRRRLMRMLERMDRADSGGVEREHLLARAGDLSDLALSLWRGLKG